VISRVVSEATMPCEAHDGVCHIFVDTAAVPREGANESCVKTRSVQRPGTCNAPNACSFNKACERIPPMIVRAIAARGVEHAGG